MSLVRRPICANNVIIQIRSAQYMFKLKDKELEDKKSILNFFQCKLDETFNKFSFM